MRTITITEEVYRFDELTEEAKDSAIDNCRYSIDLSWQTENRDTVEAIAEKMRWKYSYESYDGITYTVDYDIDDEDISALSGVRAMAYIENNYINAARQAKTYWLHGVLYCDGRKNWTRKSKINFTIDNCPFTGYCMDCCFSEAWKDWKRTFCKNSTVQDFADMVADRLGKDWTSDNEYQVSDEGIIEMIEASDYEFLADGTIY